MSVTAANIAQILTEKLEVPIEMVDAGASFEEMDLDSLVLVQLAVVLEQRHGVSVEDWELKEAGTIENVVALVGAKTAAR